MLLLDIQSQLDAVKTIDDLFKLIIIVLMGTLIIVVTAGVRVFLLGRKDVEARRVDSLKFMSAVENLVTATNSQTTAMGAMTNVLGKVAEKQDSIIGNQQVLLDRTKK